MTRTNGSESLNSFSLSLLSCQLDKSVGKVNYDKIDREVAKYASHTRVEISPEENDRLRRMIDKRVLSIMITTYFLQSLDKGILSFASIMGLPQDTGMVQPNGNVSQQYSWLTSSFIVLSSTWFRREEQAAQVTYWYMMNGAQQMVGGLLAYCFSLIHTGPPKSWQWLFLSYGIVSVFFGVFVLLWIPDSPMRAKCFNEEDKRLMVERVRDNQTGVQNRTFKKEHVYEALRDLQMWCYGLIQFCTVLPTTSGLSTFANIIIKESLGFDVLQTQLLSMVLGAYIIILLLVSVWMVNKWNQNILTCLGFVVFSFVGTMLLMTVPNVTFSQHVGLLISYYITMSFWTAQTLGLSMMSRNVGGQTKKTIVVAANFIFWSAGNAIGPQVFLARESPKYYTAFSTYLGCFSLLVVVLIFFRWHLVRENKKRDAMAAAGVREANDGNMTHAFEDLTDRENPNFRYVY
ncbi:unnamed protein product [Clonostachys rosea]|uniref:Major facilitator superfamily (MFS) profile domain-containing protein n=1 Tax=Bionectria ochroleuca TaxID=29856 RepID=A0ABY6U218_BIOOC|nr:unnamed protein product [Clonostachys rosea]